MNKRTFFAEYKRIIREAFDRTTKANAELSRLDEEIKSGRFSPDHVERELKPARAEMARESRKATEDAQKKVYDLIDAYQAELRAHDALKPEEITEDIRLLQSGLPLSDRDLNDILARCAGNQTMCALTARYAKEHGITLTGVDTAPGARAASDIESMRQVAHIILRHADDCSVKSAESMFERVLGDSSEAAAFFNQAE